MHGCRIAVTRLAERTFQLRRHPSAMIVRGLKTQASVASQIEGDVTVSKQKIRDIYDTKACIDRDLFPWEQSGDAFQKWFGSMVNKVSIRETEMRGKGVFADRPLSVDDKVAYIGTHHINLSEISLYADTAQAFPFAGQTRYVVGEKPDDVEFACTGGSVINDLNMDGRLFALLDQFDLKQSPAENSRILFEFITGYQENTLSTNNLRLESSSGVLFFKLTADAKPDEELSNEYGPWFWFTSLVPGIFSAEYLQALATELCHRYNENQAVLPDRLQERVRQGVIQIASDYIEVE